MTDFNILIRNKRDDVCIAYVYSYGHDNNLPGWEEEAAEELPELCKLYGDSGNCHLVGEAKWMYLRFTKSRIAVIKSEQCDGCEPVTMQRVHRNNTTI